MDEQRDLDLEIRRRRALARIRVFGDPALRCTALPVEKFDAVLAREAEEMIEIMEFASGVGLAATQLGIMHRLIVYRAGHEAPPEVLVNPSIEWSSDEREAGEEGCLSLPGVALDVERPVAARVTARAVDGSERRVEAEGLEARIIQHEIDHLEGVLILDHADREQRKTALQILRGEIEPVTTPIDERA